MYSCCSFEDETAPSGAKSLPLHHHTAMVTVSAQPHVVTTSMTNPAHAMAQQQQQPQQQQPQPVYKTPLPGSPPTVLHSGTALGSSSNPIAGAPLPCSTFLPRPDRRLAVVDRWRLPKTVTATNPMAVRGAINDMGPFAQKVPPNWASAAGGGGGLDGYKRYYGPIDPEGLGPCMEQQVGTQTPKTMPRGHPQPPPASVAFFSEKSMDHGVGKKVVGGGGGGQGKGAVKPLGTPRLPPKSQAPLPPTPPLPHPSPPLPSSFWRKRRPKKPKEPGGPLYENILPLGRRGGARDGVRDGGGRRARPLSPPLSLPVPVPLSPSYTPPSPSASLHYTSSSASSTTSSTSSSSSASSSRSSSPTYSYSSSRSADDRTGGLDGEDDDDEELTEESSLLLGRGRERERSIIRPRSLSHGRLPPPIPPRKPRTSWGDRERERERERGGSQLSQLQEWWASWNDRDRRGSVGDAERQKMVKRRRKEKEKEKKRKKKNKKRKKREERERERERERKRRKVKKKKKALKTKKRKKSIGNEKRSEPEEGDVELEREGEPEGEREGGIQDYASFSSQYRNAFAEKGRNSWEGERERNRREGVEEGIDREEEESRRSRERRPKSSHSHSRHNTNSKRYPNLNKLPASVKFWGNGRGDGSNAQPSSFHPLLPSSKRRKGGRTDREDSSKVGERRPLLMRYEKDKAQTREGLSFHEWDSDEEDDEEEEERDDVRERMEERGRRTGRGTVSESERDRTRLEDSYSDEGSSGEFGRFERYWDEGAEGGGTGIGGIGGGGWFFGTYPSREKGGSINSRDDSLLGTRAEGWFGADFWGSGPGVGWGSGGGSGGLGSQWPPPPAAFPPPRRYWSMDKIPVKGEKKLKRGGPKSKGRTRELVEDAGRSTMCSCSLYPHPHPYPHPHSRSQTSHSKRGSSAHSHSQEELIPHSHSFSGGSHPKSLPSKPDPSQAKSGSQSNLSLSTQPTDHPPPPTPSSPQQPTSLPMPIPPPPSSSSISPPAGVGIAGQAQASASAKLQYQRLRSVPQPRRFYSPHLPLKAKSLCSRRGSAHFSSLESEV